MRCWMVLIAIKKQPCEALKLKAIQSITVEVRRSLCHHSVWLAPYAPYVRNSSGVKVTSVTFFVLWKVGMKVASPRTSLNKRFEAMVTGPHLDACQLRIHEDSLWVSLGSEFLSQIVRCGIPDLEELQAGDPWVSNFVVFCTRKKRGTCLHRRKSPTGRSEDRPLRSHALNERKEMNLCVGCVLCCVLW